MKHIIYIPGLGGSKTLEIQRQRITRWNRQDIKAIMFEPAWHSSESPEDKLTRAIKFIDDNVEDKVRLYGASAGGPLCVALLRERPEKISQLRLICPKLKGSHRIGKYYDRKAPAMRSIVEISEEFLKVAKNKELSKIYSYRPIYEFVVPLQDMKVAGGQNRLLLSFGHIFTIAFAILFLLKPR